MNISVRSQKIVLGAGLGLCVVGAAIAYWALSRFDGLPNHLRVASALPLFLGYAMLHVRDYANWQTLPPTGKIRAVGAAIPPFVLAIGAILWHMVAPGVHA